MPGARGAPGFPSVMSSSAMSRAQLYAQLVRLPNLPSAFADILLGALATGALRGHWLPFAFLLPASGCLYCAGMVWNDFFDVEQDKRERPFRPIASGRVSRLEAALLGGVLLLSGVLVAALADLAQDMPAWRSVIVALFLVPAILLYDGWLKRTPLGPLGMGVCRFLNVLLGLSASGHISIPNADGNLSTGLGIHLAFVVGLYIVGVTWLARTEARVSSKKQLTGAALVMLASLFFGLAVAARVAADKPSPLFPYLLVGLGIVVGLPIQQAIRKPTPERVQTAVKRSLMGLVLLDAVLATAVAGSLGLIVLVLLVPSLYLNRRRWLYAT
jgi:4-hydroxybenzoate polyprenyltransferase